MRDVILFSVIYLAVVIWPYFVSGLKSIICRAAYFLGKIDLI